MISIFIFILLVTAMISVFKICDWQTLRFFHCLLLRILFWLFKTFHQNSSLKTLSTSGFLSFACLLFMLCSGTIFSSSFLTSQYSIQSLIMNDFQLREKPGRQCVTFLLLCNFALWVISTFETQRIEYNQTQVRQETKTSVIGWLVCCRVFHLFDWLPNLWWEDEVLEFSYQSFCSIISWLKWCFLLSVLMEPAYPIDENLINKCQWGFYSRNKLRPCLRYLMIDVYASLCISVCFLVCFYMTG